MKHFLIFLFIILNISAFSQNRFPSVDSAKNYVLRYVKNSAVETFTNWRAQNVTYGTLELLDSLAGSGAIDSIWKTGDTLKYSKLGVNYTIGIIAASDTATVVKAYVTNAEAVTITKGQVVYIFGASGDRAAVKLAKNTSDTFSSKTLGIVRENIAAGAAGWVTTQGQVSGINLGAYSPGDILWLDSVPGGFTKVKPVAPLHGVFVGVVERANVGNGLIYIKPQNGVELDEIHNVLINSPTNNQVLAYTSSTGVWQNNSVATALGYTPLNVTDTAAMLSPYLRSINAGVRWQGVDSSLASNWAVNGFHMQDEPLYRVSAAVNPGSFYGSSYGGIGTWNGAVENDINYIVGSTGTLSTGSATTYHGSGGSLSALYIPSSNWFIYSTRIRIPTLNDGTQKFYINIGINTTVPAATPPEGVGFLYDLDGTTTGSSASANWQTYSINGLNRTFNQNHTGVAVLANTWTKLKVLFNSSIAYYYIDDVLIATHTTNMPSGDIIAPCSGIIKTAGTTARTYHMDYNTIDIKYSTPR